MVTQNLPALTENFGWLLGAEAFENLAIPTERSEPKLKQTF